MYFTFSGWWNKEGEDFSFQKLVFVNKWTNKINLGILLSLFNIHSYSPAFGRQQILSLAEFLDPVLLVLHFVPTTANQPKKKPITRTGLCPLAIGIEKHSASGDIIWRNIINMQHIFTCLPSSPDTWWENKRCEFSWKDTFSLCKCDSYYSIKTWVSFSRHRQ